MARRLDRAAAGGAARRQRRCLAHATATRVERLELLARALVAGDAVRRAGLAATRAVLDVHRRRAAARACDAAATAELDGPAAPASTAASSRPGRPARRRAGGPTCCRPGATSTRSTPARCRRRRPGRSAGSRPALLLDRHRAGARRLAARDGAVRLGHGQHAHRRRRHRAGAGADRRAADLGRGARAASPASRSCRCRVLDRPRVDVTLRISGFFRDAFPAQIDLFDSAVRAVAALDEPEAHEPARRPRARRTRERWSPPASPRRGAQRRARLPRVRLQARRLWRRAAGADRRARLGRRAAISRAPISPGAATPMAAAPRATRAHGLFERAARARSTRCCTTRTTASTTCSTATTTTSSRAASRPRCKHAVAAARRRSITTTTRAPRRRASARLEEEIARVVRARVVNPKWIAGVMRHGYKGAFEMAATVDYLFAFAATTDAVARPPFRRGVRRLSSPTTRCAASSSGTTRRRSREMAERLLEAQDARPVAAALQQRPRHCCSDLRARRDRR